MAADSWHDEDGVTAVEMFWCTVCDEKLCAVRVRAAVGHTELPSVIMLRPFPDRIRVLQIQARLYRRPSRHPLES